MPESDTYKLLRTGNMRSTQIRGTGRSARYGSKSAILLAPDLNAFGHRRFTPYELRTLVKLLQSPEWPRGTLNIVGLEGLLTAFLVLPTGLHPGSCLPLIWNETGWKLPSLLRDARQFAEFTELVCGFLRTLDAGLRAVPPQFNSVINHHVLGSIADGDYSIKAWSLGFGRLVGQLQHLSAPTNPLTHRALYAIANFAQSPRTKNQSESTQPAILLRAVLALAKERGSSPLNPQLKNSN